MSRKAVLVPSQFGAVAFDLDGVVTDTAGIHFQAWSQTFDFFSKGAPAAPVLPLRHSRSRTIAATSTGVRAKMLFVRFWPREAWR